MNKSHKKKQSIGKRVPCFWDDDDEDDIATVAEILIQLPDLILHPVPSSSVVWGAKRRRSAISGAVRTKSVVYATATVNSPATPLMFSPSESDDKPNNNNNSNTPSRVSPISKRKNKDELMQSVTELTHQKDSLVKEMEAAKRDLDVLRASNIELKHRKQLQMIYGFAQPPLQVQTLQQHQQQPIHYPFQMQHQHPSNSIQWSNLPSLPAVNKMGLGPVGLPDLNLTLEEAANNVNELVGIERHQATDVTMVMDYNANSRALASAQARKRRMLIYKEKNQNQVQRQR